MTRRRREKQRASGAVLASLALHGLGLVFVLGVEGSEVPKPRVKVYRVDIVSPPPTQAGEPMPEPPANQEPGPAQAETPAAQPEPTPPAPEPAKAPPAERTPPKEPEKAPEARRPPETPRERPAATPATRPATPATRPATPATRPGSGGDTDRSRGEGTRTGPTTGRSPDPNSQGGEGLTVRSAGMDCVGGPYCNNVIRQVRRFFRAPEGSSGSGNVCFRIRRDGGVDGIRAERVRGGPAFRLAMMEAVEQAGSRRAFGPLPAAFGTDGLTVCVELSPENL